MLFYSDSYDVIVVGAGHAGIEAALAAARLGARTALFTLSLDAIGNMPCNPAIGGAGKSQLVFELDALGGEMPRAADATGIESRMLNLTKGPAVHSLRVQCDRAKYHTYMKHVLELQEKLDLIQDEVVSVQTENGRVTSVTSAIGHRFSTGAVILCCGTYLGGKIFIGDFSRISGPDGTLAATRLTENLKELGLPIRRFKTGTPARVLRRSIDFSALEIQRGDPFPIAFSSMTDPSEIENDACCYITYTNEKTHEVIRRNLHRSPLYGGAIEGIGPRYCPSIEDKVVRFPEKPRHQIFIEPCGNSTEEMYLQGMSSSLPLDVQYEMYRTIPGLEHMQIMRPAYAIEYDCVDPLWLSPTLMSKTIIGFFGAGQFNGTSGYEEAAAQGFVAGVNAAALVAGKQPLILRRDESYIGTLIDDLVTKGVQDPYRMMTARSEYRLSLRQDNADLRLIEIGRSLGLIGDEKWQRFLETKTALEKEIELLRNTRISCSAELSEILESNGSAPFNGSISAADLIRRPGMNYRLVQPFLPGQENCDLRIALRAETELKYEGYLKRQKNQIEKQKRLESMLIPAGTDYREILGLRTEAVQKLCAVQPISMGQASRISGVNPSDMAVLAVWLEKHKRRDS